MAVKQRMTGKAVALPYLVKIILMVAVVLVVIGIFTGRTLDAAQDILKLVGLEEKCKETRLTESQYKEQMQNAVDTGKTGNAVKLYLDYIACFPKGEYEPSLEVVVMAAQYELIPKKMLQTAMYVLTAAIKRAESSGSKSALADAYNALGLAQRMTGHRKEAANSYRSALEKAETSEAKHEAYHELGIELRAAGKYEDALKLYRQEAEDFPDSGKAWLNIGETYADQKDNENALEAYKQAAKHADAKAAALSQTALLYEKTGRPELAIQSYTDAAKESYQTTGAYVFDLQQLVNNLAEKLTVEGKRDDAAAMYARLVQALQAMMPKPPVDTNEAWYRALFRVQLDAAARAAALSPSQGAGLYRAISDRLKQDFSGRYSVEEEAAHMYDDAVFSEAQIKESLGKLAEALKLYDILSIGHKHYQEAAAKAANICEKNPALEECKPSTPPQPTLPPPQGGTGINCRATGGTCRTSCGLLRPIGSSDCPRGETCCITREQ
ncbi:tetratricopeptide repeat protein [Candidatus Woesearchaeota archaeon]|nr:tetratricopeptide repeat protein [Candidatus Woesearchaeota archaeon]